MGRSITVVGSVALILEEFQEVSAARLHQIKHAVKASFVIRVWDTAAVPGRDEAEEQSGALGWRAETQEIRPIGLVHCDDPVPLVELARLHLARALVSDVDAAGQGDVDRPLVGRVTDVPAARTGLVDDEVIRRACGIHQVAEDALRER